MYDNQWQYLDIKPMSVNEAYKGEVRISPTYTAYKHKVRCKLLEMDIPYSEKYLIKINFGLSNNSADWDNPIKPFQDILQTKYKFNDKVIFKGIIEKWIVPKGYEFIEFKIEPYEQKPWIRNVE